MKKRPRALFLSLLVLSSAASLASAEEPKSKPADAFETVSVTGTRLPANAIPGSFDVIDADAIEVSNSLSISELLRHAPGVDVSKPGGTGAAELFLRGAESNFTTVLVDGMRVNNPANSRGGSYDFAALDLGQVERIEIIRGPMSSVYGADALSGVVNIITRAPARSPAAAFGGEIGVEDYSRIYARAAAPLSHQWSGSLFAAHSNAPEDVEGYTARLDAAQLALDYADVDRSGRLRARYGDTAQTAFPDASGGPLFSVGRELQRVEGRERAVSADVQQRISSRWISQLFASILEREEGLSTPAILAGPVAVTPRAESGSRFRAQQATLNNQILLGRLSLAAGGEVRREAGRQSGLLHFDSFTLPASFDLDRTTYAGFGEGRYAATKGVTLFAGARWDKPDTFDSRASARLGVNYLHAGTGLRVHAGWTNGFKLPSFYALGDSLVGNPALREEEAEATELGVELPLDDQRINLGITAYVARYRDLIDFDFATFRLVNRSRARIRGAEGNFSIAPQQNLRLGVQAGYTDIDVDGEAVPLPLRPKWRGGVTAIWRPDSQWTLHSSVMSIGARRASSIPTGDLMLARYTRLDLAVTRRIHDTYRLSFAVDNALNERYQEDAGVPSPGVIVRLGAERAFQ